MSSEDDHNSSAPEEEEEEESDVDDYSSAASDSDGDDDDAAPTADDGTVAADAPETPVSWEDLVSNATADDARNVSTADRPPSDFRDSSTRCATRARS